MKKNTRPSAKKDANSSYYDFLPKASKPESKMEAGVLKTLEDKKGSTNLQKQFNQLSLMNNTKNFQDNTAYPPLDNKPKTPDELLSQFAKRGTVAGKVVLPAYPYPSQSAKEPSINNFQTSENKPSANQAKSLESFRDSSNSTSLKFNACDKNALKDMLSNLGADNSFTSLSINMQFNRDTAKELAKCLKNNKSLTSIEITDHGLKENAMNIALEALQLSNNVTSLKFVGNKFSKKECTLAQIFSQTHRDFTTTQIDKNNILITRNVKKPISVDSVDALNTEKQGDHLFTDSSVVSDKNSSDHSAQSQEAEQQLQLHNTTSFGHNSNADDLDISISGAHNAAFESDSM